VEIGAADAGAANSHHDLTRPRRRSRPVRNGDLAGTIADQSPHLALPQNSKICTLWTKNLLPFDESICFLYKMVSR
jgi:hypothetical protein